MILTIDFKINGADFIYYNLCEIQTTNQIHFFTTSDSKSSYLRDSFSIYLFYSILNLSPSLKSIYNVQTSNFTFKIIDVQLIVTYTNTYITASCFHNHFVCFHFSLIKSFFKIYSFCMNGIVIGLNYAKRNIVLYFKRRPKYLDINFILNVLHCLEASNEIYKIHRLIFTYKFLFFLLC